MKHKGFSFINIFGLSIGLTCCMLISLYIFYENSYDQYHEKGDQIYQLGIIFDNEGKGEHRVTVPAALGDLIKQDFPEIQERTRLLSLFQDDKTLLQYEEAGNIAESFYETNGYLADPAHFKIFTYNFIEGDPATALNEPNTVVVAEEIARKFFGDQPALNKVLKISSSTNGDHEFLITGVFRAQDEPSHLDARFIMSPKGGNLEQYFINSTTLLNNNMFFTYFLLDKGVNPHQVESKFPAFVERHMGKELRERGTDRKLFLTNIEDIHLHPTIETYVTPSGSKTYLHILASIAILTLLIACINFMNLSTSRSSKRSLEVGVRKVLGAEKGSLIYQFLGESLILAFLAFLLAIIFTTLLLPLFQQISGKEIIFNFNQHGILLAGFILLAVITGLLAGSYPAFYLSSFKPVRVLKGRFSNSLSATALRKGLVIFQFVISVVLIIGSVVISKQMNYLRSKDLGFIKDQQVVIPLRSNLSKSNFLALKNNLTHNNAVNSAGGSLYYPGIFNPMDWLMHKEGNTVQDAKSVYINYVDDNYLQTLGINLVAGRLFSPQFPADTNSNIIINEKAISELGFSSPEEAVGEWIGFDWEGSMMKFTIVGVVKDFHFKDLHIPIEPYGFLLGKNTHFNYLIAYIKDNTGMSLKTLEQEWNALNPNEPFEYSFLDQDFQKNYQAESQLSSMIGYFTLIAIIISCLGLFGLANFSFEQRVKEIGIRKIMGASVSNLVGLLSFDFLKLVIIAIILATPIAWYIMNEWLSEFAYKITISWQIFLLTSFLAIIIALLTISFQAIKAAMVDPVKNLRVE